MTRKLLISLPTRYGGLAIPIFHETAEIDFMNSSKITSKLTAAIKEQSLRYDIIKDRKADGKIMCKDEGDTKAKVYFD